MTEGLRHGHHGLEEFWEGGGGKGERWMGHLAACAPSEASELEGAGRESMLFDP